MIVVLALAVGRDSLELSLLRLLCSLPKAQQVADDLRGVLLLGDGFPLSAAFDLYTSARADALC